MKIGKVEDCVAAANLLLKEGIKASALTIAHATWGEEEGYAKTLAYVKETHDLELAREVVHNSFSGTRINADAKELVDKIHFSEKLKQARETRDLELACEVLQNFFSSTRIKTDAKELVDEILGEKLERARKTRDLRLAREVFRNSFDGTQINQEALFLMVELVK